MFYRRLCKGLSDPGKLIPHTNDVRELVADYIEDADTDYYISTYKYTAEHKKQFDSTGTISGMNDLTTNKLWWDFDSDVEPSEAKLSTVVLVQRLIEHGIDSSDLQITFSGRKGFGVELTTSSELTPKEAKEIAFGLAANLKHFDVKMYNASRILRVLTTQHPKTSLYKIPLTFDQLKSLEMDQIYELAKRSDPDDRAEFRYDVIDLPSSLYSKKAPISNSDIFGESTASDLVPIADIDYTKKAKGWSNCKWSILNGNFKEHDRHFHVLTIVATCRSLNYPKDTAYYMAKSACKMSNQRFGGTEKPKEEIWRDVESVYGDTWNGGTYSCKDGKHTWLTELCHSLGHNRCKQERDNTGFVEVERVFDEFLDFAINIEKNTIKTGIDSLDRALRLRTGQMVGILGAPSSGKTSIALELLENTSKQGLLSVFYSLDMASSELFQKIAQRVTGLSEDALYKILQTDKVKSAEINKKVSDSYKNVKFCFDTGVSVESIQTSLEEFESQHGSKVKLLLLDYNELLSSPYSDATSSSGYNAGELKKLTNKNQLCTISLLQPPKVVGDASDEIHSYRSIKGSSLLEQCFSIIVGIYRPGFSPKNNSEDDNFLIMNILKNRLGKLQSLDFSWDGSKGQIKSLDDYGREQLAELTQRKFREKEMSKDSHFS